jgi:hypothetical protein
MNNKARTSIADKFELNKLKRIERDSRNDQFTQPSLEILNCEQVSHPAYRLYNHLLAHCIQGPECWPSLTTLANLMCSSSRSIQNWLDELENLGFITVVDRRATGQTSLIKVHNLRLITRLLDPHMNQDSYPHMNQDSYPHMNQDSYPHMNQDSCRSRLILNQINERESVVPSSQLSENSSPLGDIAHKPSSSGYVALMILGGFTAQEAERWSDYPNLPEWIELAKKKDSPAAWLRTVFNNPASSLPKSRDSRQGRPRAAKPPAPVVTPPAPVVTPPAEEAEEEWIPVSSYCKTDGCSQPAVMMHLCKAHLGKKYGGMGDD